MGPGFPKEGFFFSLRDCYFAYKGTLFPERGTLFPKCGTLFPEWGPGFAKGGPGFDKTFFQLIRVPLTGNQVPLLETRVLNLGNGTFLY